MGETSHPKDIGGRAYATKLKVGGAWLAKVSAKAFSPFTAALKLLASQKSEGHGPSAPTPVALALGTFAFIKLSICRIRSIVANLA